MITLRAWDGPWRHTLRRDIKRAMLKGELVER